MDIGNNNNTITISNVLNKYSTFVITSSNNSTVYNKYEIVVANAVGIIAVINKIESSVVNVKLSFSISGNDLIITNSGNYGALLHILMY